MGAIEQGPIWVRVLKFILRSPFSALAFIGAGILCGIYLPWITLPLTPFADVYLNLLKMVVLPFLISSVIFSIRSMVRDTKNARYLTRVAGAVIIVSAVTVAVSGALALILEPGRIDNPQSRIELGKVINSQGSVSTDLQMSLTVPDEVVETISPLSIILTIVPSNVFTALSGGDTIQVLLFCLLFGIAVGRIPQTASNSLAETLDAIYRACIILTDWFIWLLPLATFILIADQTASVGVEPLMLMADFLLVVGLCALFFVVAGLATVAVRSKQGYWATFRAFQPLLMIAITTRSSIAAIPWIISPLVEKMKFDKVVVELLVPLQGALLRAGPVIFYTVGTIFIAQLYGRTLTVPDLALIGIASALLGLTTAGMTGLVIISQLSILCGYLQIPFEAAFVLFVAVDTITDVFMTLSSVSAVTAATAVISPKREQESDVVEEIDREPQVATSG